MDKKFVKDNGLTLIAQLIIAMKGLILLPIMTKLLGPDLYGIWSQVQATVSLLLPIAFLQLGFAMTRFLAAENDKNRIGEGISSISAMVFGFTALMVFLLLIFAEPIALSVFGGVNSSIYVQITAFLLLFTCLDNIIIEYFTAFRQMKRYSIFSIFQSIGDLVLITILLIEGYGLWVALLAMIVIRGIFLLFGFLVIRPEFNIVKPNKELIKKFLIFSLPLLPFTIFIWIVNLSDRYLIAYFLNMKELGIYSAAYSIGIIIGYFWYPLSVTLLPTLTALLEDNKIDKLKLNLKYSFKYYLMFAIPSFFGLLVLSKSILLVLTSQEFLSGYYIIPLVALGTIFFNLNSINGTIFMLSEKTKAIAILYSLSAFFNIALNVILIPYMGILGAAISTLLSFMILLLSFSIIVIKNFKKFIFSIEWMFILKSSIASAIMSIIIYFINPFELMNIILTIIIGGIIYFLCLILLKGFSTNEYKFLKELIFQ